MIKKLTEAERKECMEFVKEKPAENLFIIGDIEAFGFDSDIQDLWGDYNEENALRAVLLRYRDNYIMYAPAEFDATSIAKVIDEDDRPNKFVSGISSIVKPVVERLESKPKNTREFLYAKCEELKPLEVPEVEIQLVSTQDIPRLIQLHDQIPEFEARDGREESMTRNIEEKVSRGYYISDGEKIVSSAMTTAENSVSAMVIAVCTLPGYAEKGYASAVMTRLCQDLLREGKFLCLFYDNPAAGNIYKRLGFVDIGKWVMNIF